MAEPNATPSRKVVVGGLAGSLVTILVWASKAYGHIEVPGEIAVAVSVVFTFILQYVVPNKGDSDG